MNSWKHLSQMAMTVIVPWVAAGCDGQREDIPVPQGYVTVVPLTVSAQFTVGSSLTCTERRVGDCVLRNCEHAGWPPRESAGTITVRGPSGFASCVLQAPRPGEGYEQCVSDEPLWDPESGGTLTIEASGDALDAFSAVLDAPPMVAVTSPEPELDISEGVGESAMALPRTDDLEIRWQGGGTGIIVASTSTLPSSGGVTALDCEASVSKGSLEIPAELMEELDSTLAVLAVIQTTRETMQVSEYSLNLQAKAVVSAYSLGY